MKISSEKLKVAVQNNLNMVAESNGDGWVYEVGSCKVAEDGTVRIAIKTIVPEDDTSTLWDGTEGDISGYDDSDSIEDIADELIGEGPSYQGGTLEEIDTWVSSI